MNARSCGQLGGRDGGQTIFNPDLHGPTIRVHRAVESSPGGTDPRPMGLHGTSAIDSAPSVAGRLVRGAERWSDWRTGHRWTARTLADVRSPPPPKPTEILRRSSSFA